MEVRRSGKSIKTMLEAITAFLEGNNVVVVYYNYAMATQKFGEAFDLLRTLMGCQFTSTRDSIMFRPSVVLDRGNKYRCELLRYEAEEEFTLKFVSAQGYKNECFNGWVVFHDHFQGQV